VTTDGFPGAWSGIMRSSLTRCTSRGPVWSSSKIRTTRQAAGRGHCPNWMPSMTPAGNSISQCTSAVHACSTRPRPPRSCPAGSPWQAVLSRSASPKGLGCPAGAALAGPAEVLRPGSRNRQMLGGSMRQAGVLAAAALYALRHNVTRLADDHYAAQELARRLHDPGEGGDQLCPPRPRRTGHRPQCGTTRLADAGVPRSPVTGHPCRYPSWRADYGYRRCS
jgi:hypothetical protein